METGTVKFFKVNEFGGFGFLELPNGAGDIYFQRNDGGPVEAGESKPSILTLCPVREPRKGDLINFGRSSNRQGPKAAPWCYHEEWNQALVEIAERPTYRLMRQNGHQIRGKGVVREIWRGTFLPPLSDIFPDSLTTQYNGDDWYLYWFEIETESDWERCDDPR